MKIYLETQIEQRSDEWFIAKQGKISASDIGDLLGTKNARTKYIQKKAFEILRNPPLAGVDDIMTRDMQRGIDNEPAAVSNIENRLSISDLKVGYVQFTDYFGFSPDFIDTTKTVGAEIKCLQSAAMADAVFNNAVMNKKHYWQCLTYFLVPTIQTVHYALFSPWEDNAVGEDYLYLITLEREDYQDAIEELREAITEASVEIFNLRKKL